MARRVSNGKEERKKRKREVRWGNGGGMWEAEEGDGFWMSQRREGVMRLVKI